MATNDSGGARVANNGRPSLGGLMKDAFRVDAWRREAWDLVLMDVQMPVLDGVEATRTIRALEMQEGRARVPILALTANTMSHHLEDYTAAGMDGCVSKPIDAEALMDALVSALEPALTT